MYGDTEKPGEAPDKRKSEVEAGSAGIGWEVRVCAAT